MTTVTDFSMMFDEHGAVMLIIELQTGSIVYANNAAASFYGYAKEKAGKQFDPQLVELFVHLVEGDN